MPERANLWYWLGETTIHFPRGRDDYEQGLAHFRRAAELDPNNANVLLHLHVAYSLAGDLTALAENAELRAELDGDEVTRLYARWLSAGLAGDSAAAAEVGEEYEAGPTAFPLFPFDTPAALVASWQIGPIVQSLELLQNNTIPGSASAMQRTFAVYYGYQDLGMQERADGVLSAFERATGARYDRMRLLDAIYGALPESAGLAAAGRLQAIHDTLAVERWTNTSAGERIALEMWRIMHDDLSRVPATTQELREYGTGLAPARAMGTEVQALLLEAMVQVRTGDPAARRTIEAFDELFLQGPPGLGVDVYDAMVLAAADTYERVGDPDMALQALERESNFNNLRAPYGARFARERGRLAALTGDTVRAIREYQYFTLMRSQAELSLRREVEEVRAELEILRGG